MKEIMSAGKKPVNVLVSVGDNTASASILSELVPEQQDRRQEIIEGDNDEAVDALVAFLVAFCSVRTQPLPLPSADASYY